MMGGAVGGVAHMLLPDYTGSAGAYALVGMGAAFAGIVRVPLTSVIMIFEITRDYSIIVPLMISNLISYYISSRLAGGADLRSPPAPGRHPPALRRARPRSAAHGRQRVPSRRRRCLRPPRPSPRHAIARSRSAAPGRWSTNPACAAWSTAAQLDGRRARPDARASSCRRPALSRR